MPIFSKEQQASGKRGLLRDVRGEAKQTLEL